MSKDIRVISGECCDIWNNLKDKTQMIDYLIESKKQVADLEAKLAEKQKLLEDSIDVHETEEKDIYKLRYELAGADETIQQLKQQLVEKDEEIEKLQHCNDRLAQGIYHSYGEHFILKVKQDKISFALEQLERLKKLCQEKFNWWENSELEGDIYDKSDVSNAYFDIEANIDNQIKQLKEKDNG